MCTSVIYKNRYFGRNLDYEFSYGEKIAITPRNFSFHFRNGEILNKHFAIIGMAHISDNYPLYYDAINEKA
ncbi:linear amide C-N hydrolase [Peptostreptococcus russellii]|uniref:linear amide C-N hydrolase n=1 Tax=Peptostreptococcus russellii TaxID=215200 RepID=UPI001623A6BE|nr:linear amide C-N hydrolase [Peptostreptococcus russellii]